MTEAFSTGTATVACGLASATASVAAAPASSAGGSERRSRGGRRRRAAKTAARGEAHGEAAPPRCARARRRRRRAGSRAARAGRWGRRGSSQHPRELAQPVAVGGQRHVVRAGAADRLGDRGAALGLGGGEGGAHARRAGVGLDGARRSPGRAGRAGPTSGSSASRGSVTSTRSTAWRWASARSGACQPSSRKSETTATNPRVRARRPTRSSAAASGARAAARRARRRRRRAAARRRTRRGRRAAAASRSPARPRRRRRRGRRGGPRAARPSGDALGDVGLQPQAGAERHRGADVEHDPRGQRALGHVLADVRDAGARAGRGVEPAQVVAGLVRPQLRELGARAEPRRPALAGQRPAGAARDPRSSRADRVVGRAARGPGGRAGRRASRRLRQPHRPRAGSTASSTPVDRSSGAHAVGERVVGEHEPVAQHVGGEVADVVGRGVRAAAQQRERAGGLRQPDRRARAARRTRSAARGRRGRSGRVARGVDERDGVGDRSSGRRTPRAATCWSSSRSSMSIAAARAAALDRHAVDDRDLVLDVGVVDDELEQEAVELRLGQRRCPRTRSGSAWRARGTARARGSVAPPIVTWCSCIASSSADCTFAGARLISSASRRLAKTGPSSVRNLPSPGC